MFLFQTLLVMSAIYWISALVAETFMTSSNENDLIPGVRVGFGFLLVTAYFAGAWIGMSVQQAWLLLMGLLSFIFIMQWFRTDKKILFICHFFVSKYLKTFILFLAGSLVFFAPLIISGNYGPFTESGGDITIYSDSAKLLVDEHRTALGANSKNVAIILNNFKMAFASRDIPIEPENELKSNLSDPPAAEYPNYRLNRILKDYRLLYVPSAVYQIISYPNNYPAYFAVQAFIYICILFAVSAFFRPFGSFFMSISVILVISSYALVSVFYNMYALQTTSILISILFIAALPIVPLFSFSGLRTYLPGILFIWIYYINFLSIIIPLFLYFALFVTPQKKDISEKVDPVIKKVSLLIIYSSMALP